MVLRCPIARSVIGLSPDADVAQKLQSSHRSSRARAQLLLCAQERGSVPPCCHRNGFACPGSLKSASSKGAHMAHQTEAAEGCVRVPADGGTSSLECVSIWLS